MEGGSLALTPLSLAHVPLMTVIAEAETWLWVAQEEIVYVSLWLLPMDAVLTRCKLQQAPLRANSLASYPPGYLPTGVPTFHSFYVMHLCLAVAVQQDCPQSHLPSAANVQARRHLENPWAVPSRNWELVKEQSWLPLFLVSPPIPSLLRFFPSNRRAQGRSLGNPLAEKTLT